LKDSVFIPSHTTMSTTYTDLEQISDITGASTIGHENEKFKDQCFLKLVYKYFDTTKK